MGGPGGPEWDSEGTPLFRRSKLIRADREKGLVLVQLHHLRRKDVRVPPCFREYLRDAGARFKSEKTITTDRCVLKSFFRWASLKTIGLFTTKTVMEYMACMVKVDKLAIASIRQLRETLHAFFNFVKRSGYIGENHVTADKAPKLPEHEIRFLNLRPLEGCLEAVAGHPLEPAIAYAIFTRLRREELCSLTWKDVDLTEGKPLLRVRGKTLDGKRSMPKTKRNRFVPIHPKLVPYLAALRMRAGEIPGVFPSTENRRWDSNNLGHRLGEVRGGRCRSHGSEVCPDRMQRLSPIQDRRRRPVRSGLLRRAAPAGRRDLCRAAV